MVTVVPEPIPGTLGAKWENTMNGTPVYCWAPCTHTQAIYLSPSTSWHVLRKLENLKETHTDRENMHKNSTQTVTNAQDQTGNLGAVRQQHYSLS